MNDNDKAGRASMRDVIQSGAAMALKTDLAIGLADIRAGRVRSVETARILEQGRKLLAARTRP
jgi:hypothetical protein